jgi:predicted N-acyltransferase
VADDYVTQILSSPEDVDAQSWDKLLSMQAHASLFMRHAYLAAMHQSGSATPVTGWTPYFITLSQNGTLQAACVVYSKLHSYGEYVFDWAWANAYQHHGMPYYPKAVVAVPFTPVPGVRLLARNPHARSALVQALIQWCEGMGMSSLHLLFTAAEDVAACSQAGLMLRHTVQFHWSNRALPQDTPYRDFDHFLHSLSQEKRKKIRQERRKVHESGIRFRSVLGPSITAADWDFFYRCYERTYLEHGNPPYLSRDFFQRMADTMPEHWLMFIAERNGRAIATSLIAVDAYPQSLDSLNDVEAVKRVAFGRYWGAIERVDCLHFEACYYQPLQWCIENGYTRFEGGAQGEHKMARALLPVKTTSAHWLAHPAFADAVARFLEREDAGVNNYLNELTDRSPFRQTE